MATIIRKVEPDVECTPDTNAYPEKGKIQRANLEAINKRIDAFEALIKKPNNDADIQNIFTSTAFPIKDVLRLIAENWGCDYLRVYNAINPKGTYHMFMAAVKSKDAQNTEGTQPRLMAARGDGRQESSPSGPVILRSCCPCNPCRIIAKHKIDD